MDNPRLRHLEVVPHDGSNAVLRDPLGVSSKMLLVSRDVLFICSMCDGKHSVPAIQEEWGQVFDEPLEGERIEEILQQLDDCFFLVNTNFIREKERIELDFLGSQVREPFFAGTGYDSNPQTLRNYLDEEFGKLGQEKRGPLRGIVAPHIDISRGIGCYAAVYNSLYGLTDIDLVVILGVSHSMSKNGIILTGKDFKTPFGVAETDRAIFDGLRGRLPHDFFTDEILHRNEHSVEFQVLLTQYILEAGKSFSILPVLCCECGNLEEEAGVFAETLLTCIKAEKRNPLFIAGADLSHLGKRFGQEADMSREYLSKAEAKDREMLEGICAGNSEEFLKSIRKENNSRNVCGVPAIYTLLKLLEPVKAGSSELVCYNQAVEKDTNSMVSYAGIRFS